MQASIRISQAEIQARADKLRAFLQGNELTGVVLFDSQYIYYYSGFHFMPTERPMAFVMNSQGEKALFVPRLEVEHAQTYANIDRVDHYLEYPSDPHPMELFKQTLIDMGVGSRFGVDSDGYPWIFGYRGPSLSELTDSEPLHVAGFIEEQMMIKSPAELALLRESAKWANLAHMLLQRYTCVGVTETSVTLRASSEATLAMLDAIGPLYRGQSPYVQGAYATYRGQIGRGAAIPHTLANNITFQAGDVLVTGATAPVWGYHAELERTMIIGPASDEQRHLFDHMLALQETAFQAMGPGIPCAEVDKAVRAYYEKHELWDYWRHHVGHAIGLRYHEAPFLDRGDHTIMQPGMVFTVEPGLYAANLGGFRHSDTVAITEDGIEIITYYPRDLASLTLAA